MPGRKRHSWRLSVILDTSASMGDEVPRALGAIADFCDRAGVDEIRVIQCDTTVTSDETLSPSALDEAKRGSAPSSGCDDAPDRSSGLQASSRGALAGIRFQAGAQRQPMTPSNRKDSHGNDRQPWGGFEFYVKLDS